MLSQNSAGIYQSGLLAAIPGLKHGFSTKRLGDMRKPQSRARLLEALNLPEKVILGQQIHGNKIGIISGRGNDFIISGVDGLISRSGKMAFTLGVRTADCVPILAVDPVKKIIGVAHAGWRGTLTNISGTLLAAMTRETADPRDILVSIGPHIGVCCYDIDAKRVDKFKEVFGRDSKILIKRRNKYYLDLGRINYNCLVAGGVLKKHIDRDAHCTFGLAGEFYSYRRDDNESFGEMLGVISYGNPKN